MKIVCYEMGVRYMILKSIIENNDTKHGCIFDLFIQAVIIISLVSFSVETIPNLPHGLALALSYIEVATVSVFSVEYVLRLIVADRKLKFIFSFYGLIDLFSVLPFYLSVGIDLRSIRIVRLLRLFRTLKLVRYNRAFSRFYTAIVLVKEELIIFFVVSSMILYFASVGIYYLESEAQPENFTSIFHSMWWSIVTLTTVGYGDVYPVTTGGKVFTSFILLIGLGIVAVPTGLIASALSASRDME